MKLCSRCREQQLYYVNKALKAGCSVFNAQVFLLYPEKQFFRAYPSCRFRKKRTSIPKNHVTGPKARLL